MGRNECDTYLPLVVVWEITLDCNMQCRHCGSGAGKRREAELSTDRAIEFCDELAEALCREVTLSGGEALLRQDWWRIASNLHEKGIEVKLFSNGLLLDKRNLDRAIANHVRSVCVSMDGTAKIHNQIRGRDDSFRHILRAFRNMRDLNLPIHVVTTVSRWNMGCLCDLFHILVEENVPYWQIQMAVPCGRMRDNFDYVLSREEYLQLAHRIDRLRKNGKERGMDVRAGHNIGYNCELSQSIRGKKWMGCPAGLFGCGIESNGNVKGCLSIQAPGFVEGNINDRSFWDIWFDDGAFAYNRHFKAENLTETCRSCPHVQSCRGGCVSSYYSLAAMPDSNGPLCLARQSSI